MKLRFPYFNDSDIGYIDEDFLDKNEQIIFIDSEEEEKEKLTNEIKQIQPISERE
jgi:hypothetical protein